MSNVSVYQRIKPNLHAEDCHLCPMSPQGLEIIDNKSEKENQDQQLLVSFLKKNTDTKVFSFDHIFNESSGQEEIFEKLKPTMLESAVDGIDYCLMAYGQTGSGKTHTILGDPFDEESRGILPRFGEAIFKKLKEIEEEHIENKSCVTASFFEIYNENFYDLLRDYSSDDEYSKNKKNLQIRENPKKGVYIEGLSEIHVNNKQETLDVFELGAQNRRTAETRLNERSSRSHAVFTIKVETKQLRETSADSSLSKSLRVKTKSQFYFVDLAGSERQLIEGPVSHLDSATMDRTKESCKINQSLVVLSNVIASQSKSQKYPHFRDSKLTYYLKDVFGNNARTTLITNIVNESDYLFETYNTLRFGQTAKTIKVDVKANYEAMNHHNENGMNLTEDELRQEVNHLMKQIEQKEKMHKKLPEITNEDSIKVVKQLENSWEKIKERVVRKGIVAKKFIDEIELQFVNGIDFVKDNFEKYDCSILINTNCTSNLKNVLKDMETFFDKLANNDRLLNGVRAPKNKTGLDMIITPQNFEQRVVDIRAKMIEWLSKVIKTIKSKEKQYNASQSLNESTASNTHQPIENYQLNNYQINNSNDLLKLSKDEESLNSQRRLGYNQDVPSTSKKRKPNRPDSSRNRNLSKSKNFEGYSSRRKTPSCDIQKRFMQNDKYFKKERSKSQTHKNSATKLIKNAKSNASYVTPNTYNGQILNYKTGVTSSIRDDSANNSFNEYPSNKITSFDEKKLESPLEDPFLKKATSKIEHSRNKCPKNMQDQGVQTEETWDYLDRLEVQLGSYENRQLELNKSHNDFVNDIKTNKSDAYYINEELREQLVTKNDEIINLEQKIHQTERKLTSKIRKKNEQLEAKQDTIIKQIKKINGMAENENKLKNQIVNLESSLNLQKDFRERISVSATREKEKNHHNCLACFDGSPHKCKSPKQVLNPDHDSESSISGYNLQIKKSHSHSFNDNLDHAGMMIKVNTIQKKLEVEMKKNSKLEEEKRFWVISKNDMMGNSTRNTTNNTQNIENEKGNYGKNYNQKDENMSEESITGTTGDKRKSHRKSHTDRNETYKENFDSDGIRYALKGKNSNNDINFKNDYTNSRRLSRNRNSRSTSLNSNKEQNLSPNIVYDKFNNIKLNPDQRIPKKDDRSSQREPRDTTDMNKANKKISDLEKMIDKKARELKFYKQEVSGLQNQNEKLLNCGFESKETGKLDINDLVLENNRLKEYICNRKK